MDEDRDGHGEERQGLVLAPRVWCRQRWCREDPNAAHRFGDGCSCERHGTAEECEPRIVTLKAHAARLPAFRCRACSRQTRRMVEYPVLFFRCEDCAAADRWPDLRGSRRG
jgi:hypothetical protein